MIKTPKEMRGKLREECDAAGSVKGWAKRHGVHWAHVYNVLLGKKEPGDKVLGPLGMEKVVVYREKMGREEDE